MFDAGWRVTAREQWFVPADAAAPRPVVFAYDFPHRKTQDVMLRLVAEGIAPVAVIAAPRVDLPPAPIPALRTQLRSVDLLPPSELCRALRIPYYREPHNSERAISILRELKPEAGLITGARILKRNVIAAVDGGIVNLHPGPIPEARGLDAILWTIYDGLPYTVTAHLIDENIDAGKIACTVEVEEFPDDVLAEIGHRVLQAQLAVVRRALSACGPTVAPGLPAAATHIPPRGVMPSALRREIPRRLSERQRSLQVGEDGDD
jgi:phosphoribosylglycinamide formyltransferase-1